VRYFKTLHWITALLCAGPASLSAQGVTAFKTGEETTGMTKQCFYSFGSNRYTKTVRSVELCPLSIEVSMTGRSESPTRRGVPVPPRAPTVPTVPRSSGITAFKTGERTTGMTKQCYYAFGSNEYTKTIQSVELCPLSIQVRLP